MRYTDGDEIHTAYLDNGAIKHVVHRATSCGCCWDELEYMSGDKPEGKGYECLYRVNLTKKTIAFGDGPEIKEPPSHAILKQVGG